MAYLLITAAVFLLPVFSASSSSGCSSLASTTAAARVSRWADKLAWPDSGTAGSQQLSADDYRSSNRAAAVGATLNNYCESWKLNVELNNKRAFDEVPSECASYIGNYMTSPQYGADVQKAIEECELYLVFEFVLSGDDKDVWIFDVDDTLLSTLPFFQSHSYGAEKVNQTLFDEWKTQANAPAVDNMVCLYQKIRLAGMKIILISSRPEHLRSATVNNLVDAGYSGWTRLIMRPGQPDGYKTVKQFKQEARKKLITQEVYHLWGIMGDQWSSLLGETAPRRFFKLPNPMYYVV